MSGEPVVIDTGRAIHGIAAVVQMLDCIGATEPSGDAAGDHAVAKILVDNELELRELVSYALNSLACGGGDG